MNIIIFTGPTLQPSRGKQVLDAVYLPPVSQGDVYRAAALKPFAIGIIDGLFDKVPSVWHKEILWAMAQGIHVFGGASIGALRAAELDCFGMKGIGWVYKAFRDGLLEDDDEVAVVHDESFAQLSEPMVNIRRTLEKARIKGVIGSITRSVLTDCAKRTFYPQRTYSYILELGYQSGLSLIELSKLRSWLQDNRVDQKLNDAIDLLDALRALTETSHSPKTVNFTLENTYHFEQLKHEAGELRINGSSPQIVFTNDILDELRLEGESYLLAVDWCLKELLAQDDLHFHKDDITETLFLETVAWFRERCSLVTTKDLKNWLNEQGITDEQFIDLMHKEAMLRRAQIMLADQVNRLLPKWLCFTGRYSQLADRSAHKQSILAKHGLENPSPQKVGLSDHSLLRWYFRERLGYAPPKVLTPHLRYLDFRNEADFFHVIRREKCYLAYVGNRNPKNIVGLHKNKKSVYRHCQQSCSRERR